MTALNILRSERPRLYHPVGDPAYAFLPPRDPVRQRIRATILADAKKLESRKPVPRIPLVPDSPHPFHQLYIAFYVGMEATALIEHYSFAWRLTKQDRWLKKAKQWLLAAAEWEHNDRVEEHFYTANRYLHAFAVALDWLAGGLTADEERRVTDSIVNILKRWWPNVDSSRHSAEGGHHAVVDNGHFGVAALQLLGHHPDAETWVQAVVDRFRAGIMTNGCGKEGEPVDGPSFWGAENMWMLQFADALRNVTGLDLYREFPERLTRPLLWMRYHLILPKTAPSALYAKPDTSVLNGTGYAQLDEISPVLMRLAQEAGDGPMRAIALRDPLLGRVHRLGAGVKNAPAECLYNFAPYAYLFYDPDFKPFTHIPALPVSRVFTAHHGDELLLRSEWGDSPQTMVAVINAYNGGVTHGFSRLHLHYGGHPVLKTISAAEAAPVGCGNLPCVGGQNEIITRLGPVECGADSDRVTVDSARLRQTYTLLRGRHPALLAVLSRKPRGLLPMLENGEIFVRTDGTDYLQYPTEEFFNPDAGTLRLRVRLLHKPDWNRPQILFHTGPSVPLAGLGTGTNAFALGFFPDHTLCFAVQSQRYLVVKASLNAETPAFAPGRWMNIAARWGGFNKAGASPFIELEADGHVQRFDDPAVFGELGKDTQGLNSRQTPRTFFTRPNTVIGFGAAVQFPGTGAACDFAAIELVCPSRRPLRTQFETGRDGETGNGVLQLKLNPVQLVKQTAKSALLRAGPRTIRVLDLSAAHARFSRELVPYYPGGLAAASLKRFVAGQEDASVRLRITAGNDDPLMLLFVDERAKVEVETAGETRRLILDGRPFPL